MADGSRYKDKFLLTDEARAEQNRRALNDALESLYATHIEGEMLAEQRGKAIRAINAIARALGYSDIARND